MSEPAGDSHRNARTPVEPLPLYRAMVRVRAFEDGLLKLSQDGLLRGSLHLARGQEAVAAGLGAALLTSDTLTVTYRGHGIALAKGCPMPDLLCEILGRTGRLGDGYGGKMHLTDLKHGLLGANGIVGAGVPIAAGSALSHRMDRNGHLACAVFGDGALNQGAVPETLNIAALMSLPLLLVCENNLYAEMTPLERSSAVVDLARRVAAFGVRTVTVDGNDPVGFATAVREAAGFVRAGGGPLFLEAMTYRISGHYHLDPGTGYRAKEEVETWRARDPILALRAEIGPAEAERCEADAAEEVAEAIAFALAQPEPEPLRMEARMFR